MKLKTRLFITFVSVMILPTIFTTVAMYTMDPKQVGEMQQMFLLIIFVTAAFLIFWIYRAVSVPLQKLQEAARNIKEGNLDFELKYEADDEFGQICRDFEEMRQQDVADYLGIKQQSVNDLLNRALKTMKKKAENEEF